ncbi:TolC family protein [Desulfosediminicola sp.]|uniref:TolC family protein n=1 Tax=Desulfosediminicola sp. TaxID=2886825 RepID=UPI003AF20E5A
MTRTHLTVLAISLLSLSVTTTNSISAVATYGQGEESARERALQITGKWTLADAVDFALANNPAPKIAKDSTTARASEVDAANSAFFPSLTLASEYSQTDRPMYSFGNILNQGAFDDSIDFNNPGRTDALVLEAQIDYPIYDGGKRRARVDQAQAAEVAALHHQEDVEQNLAFEVIQSFHRIVQAGEMVTVRKAEINAITASLQVGQARFEAGALLREDLLNLELQKERATENHIRSIHNQRLAKTRFWNLLGFESTPPDIMPEHVTVQSIPKSITPENRRELKLMEARIRQGEAVLQHAKGDSLPTIDSFGQYQFEHGTILGESGDSWLAGVRLEYSLYNGNRTEAMVAAAKAGLAGLKREHEQLRLAISLDIQQAEIQYQQSLERLQVTQKMVQVAEKSSELSRARFQEGLILVSDLIDFEMRLTDAKARRASARADNQIAIANLRRAVGIDQFPVTNSL